MEPQFTSFTIGLEIFDPVKWLETLIEFATLRRVSHDVGQDFEIWENKIDVTEPRLAKGDAPIGPYRL